MSQANQRPTLRARKKTATGVEVKDRKRKSRPSITEEDCRSTKRKSHSKTNKEMTLESNEELDSSFCNTYSNIENIESSKLTVVTQPEKRRRSLRQKAIKNNVDDAKEQLKCPPILSRPQTPTELINDMTSFTFSNYFTPISKDSSPLPQLSWADANEVWEIMLEKDRKYKRDYLYIRKHPSLQPRMRAVLLDWLIEVCEVYRLHRETFYLAVDFVDRYLSTQRNIAKTRLQLVGVTALFVAAKIEEIYPPKLSEFSYVTDGACIDKEILQQEMLLLQALDWKLSPVTPICWLTVYLQIANRKLSGAYKENVDEYFELPQFSGIHLCRVSELIDVCCLDTGYLQFSYSIIAASALYHMWGKDVTTITGHKFEELFPCIQWLSPYAKVVHNQTVKPIKQFDKIQAEDAHNIQVHNNGVQLLDYVHSQMNSILPVNNIKRTSPMVQCKGLLTPPRSTEKEFM